MKIYSVTIHQPWDGKETASIHMTRKGALQVACELSLQTMIAVDGFEDETLTWIEENLYALDNPNHSHTIAELDGIFKYAEKLLWEMETEIEIVWHILQP